jgi:hypothetical protein
VSRRATWLAALAVAAICAGTAAAQPPGAGSGSPPAAEAEGSTERPVGAADPGAAKTGEAAKWGDGRAVQDPRDKPAEGAPYRWRQMFFAGLLMLVMLAGVVWIVRRSKRAG